MVVTSRFLAAMVLAVAGALAACLFGSGAQFVVLALALLALFAVFCAALWSRAGASFSPFDLGIVFAAWIAAYSALPLLAFALTGFPETRLDDFADSRLLVIRVTEDAVVHVGLLYGSLLLSFCAAYYATSSGRPAQPPPPNGNWRGTTVVVAVAYVSMASLPALARTVFGISDPESYAGSYTQFLHLPIVAQQVLHHWYGVAMGLKILLVLLLIHAFRERSLWLIGAWIMLELALVVAQSGARTPLFMLLFLALLGYHLLVRPIDPRLVVAGAAVAISLFLMLGAVRDLLFAEAAGGGGAFLTRNEFVSVFINALDLVWLSEEARIVDYGARFMFADVLRPIPQQLLWFEKIDPAQWYVNTFYKEYAGMGGGLAFGIVAESILGFGAMDLIARGIMLGVALGTAQAWLTRRPGIWKLACYVWLLANCYQSIRNSTFVPATLFLYNFLPVLVLGWILHAWSARREAPGGREDSLASSPATRGG